MKAHRVKKHATENRPGPTKHAQVGAPAVEGIVTIEPRDGSVVDTITQRRTIELVAENADAWHGFPVTWSEADRATLGYLVFPKHSWRIVKRRIMVGP